jgi:hypothetical protein
MMTNDKNAEMNAFIFNYMEYDVVQLKTMLVLHIKWKWKINYLFL